jgi:hypothetical protein
MKLKIALTAIVAFAIGSYSQTKFDQSQIKKKAPEMIRKATDETWHKAFHAGWNSAVEDPTIKLKHYLEFKSNLEEG